MILFLLSQFTDVPSLTVETLSLCGRPSLLEATRHIGRTVIHLTSTGDPAQFLSQPPQNGPPAQNAICLPSLPREKRMESQSTVAIQCHSDPTTMVVVTDCFAALLPSAIVAFS